MAGVHDLALFVLSGLLLNLTPGADTLYIVGRSMGQGMRAGATAALGIGAGCCVHTLAAAIGVSAVLMASATAFTIIKLAGAAYLVYIGVAMLRSGAVTEVPAAAARRHDPLRRVFVQGLLTNVLNPKVALFFIAFLPQFVDASAPGHFMPLMFLGAVFNFNATLWNLFTAWLASRAGAALDKRRRAMAWVSRVTGSLMVLLGLRLAFLSRE
ncbi:MAG TPA: LysE family translocator [Casimicrobiaceae bacterium]|nr:LysE family translocator [Casimicrobiaceae bacterium]